MPFVGGKGLVWAPGPSFVSVVARFVRKTLFLHLEVRGDRGSFDRFTRSLDGTLYSKPLVTG